MPLTVKLRVPVVVKVPDPALYTKGVPGASTIDAVSPGLPSPAVSTPTT